MAEDKKRKCNNCGKEFAISEGVEMLHGVTFFCKKCFKEKHTDLKKKQAEQGNAEVCEFC